MDKRVILFLIGILAGAFVVHLLAEVLSLMFSMTLGAVGFAYLAYLLFKNNWLKRPFRYKHIWQREDFDEYRWLSIAMHAIDNQLQRDTARVSEMIRYEPKLLNAIAATIISAKRERRTDDVAAVIAMLDVDYSYQREICDFSFAVEAYQNLNCYEQYKICDAVKEAVRSDRTLQHKVEQRVEKFGGFITRALTCGVEVAV